MSSPPEAWGRWGPDDERGALNRLDNAAAFRGIAAVRTGTSLALGLPLRAGGGPVVAGRPALQHFMLRDGGDYAAGLHERGFGFADDVVHMGAHLGTHLDALAHVWAGGQMWNGHSADTVTSRGARHCGIEKVGPVVTRGLFVDLGPPDGPCVDDDRAVTTVELQAAVAATGIEPQPGDVLLVRTGWLARWRSGEGNEGRWAGLDAGCAQWIDEQGFVMIGADNIAVEHGPTSDANDAAPLHVALLRDRGVYLLELLDLEALVEVHQPSFLFIVAPLPVVGGSGSPVNPIAVL